LKNPSLGLHADYHKVRNAEDLTILIRELQELWFLGGLNTLDQPEKNQEKVDLVALASEVIGSASLKLD
jgi:Surfeit locus protein 5 subunit 22 of Mediator complex